MCISRTMYPLAELDSGKKKVLFNYGVVLENRDFDSFNDLIRDWNYSILGMVTPKHPYFNKAVKEYGVKKLLKYVNVPCGHCEECNKSRARGWAYRILEEAKKYENNFFLTFTYEDDHLPLVRFNDSYVNTLVSDEISRFNKKLKTYLHRKKMNSEFRFYGVGEYGSRTLRPHYHVIYFNLDIPDLEFNYYKDGFIHFKSEFLNSVWNKGLVDIGAVDIGSACYVARYCDKKQDRDQQQKLFLKDHNIVSEFSCMSRRPGIGADALDKIIENVKNGVYSLQANGSNFSIPIYYSKKVKDILKDTKYLEDYESRCNQLIGININKDFILKDLIGERELQTYLYENDLYKKSLKKERVCI